MKKITFIFLAIAFVLNTVCVVGCSNAAYKSAPDGVTVAIHTEEQKNYLSNEYDSMFLYGDGTAEKSRPLPVNFEWDKMKVGGASAQKYVLEISESNNFEHAYNLETVDESAQVYNLMVGKQYFWRVKAFSSDGVNSLSKVFSFTTEDCAPRNLYVDGVTNVRDLGGWKIAGDKSVKQGLLYRCGRLNKSDTNTVDIEITADGMHVMRGVLNVKSEIDLRSVSGEIKENGGIESSPLGTDVNYYSVPMDYRMETGLNYLTDENSRKQIKYVFGLLSDENNYPFILHCNIGTDRTGLFAFLINGLLGVNLDDLYRDYLFSNFANIGGSRLPSNLTEYFATLRDFEGDSLSKKIENCLIDMGIEKSSLNAIKELLIED